MQNFLFLAAALCAVVAKADDTGVMSADDIGMPAQINQDHRAKFISHVDKHNLQYVGQEFEDRLAIFSANLVSIDKHNSAPEGTHTYTQGITPFTHLTSQEFAEFVNRGRNTKTKTAAEQAFHDSMPVFDGSVSDSSFGISARHLEDNLGATQTVDWRTIPGVLTPVKNQNACGSCWTFGASGALEGAYALKTSSTAPTETLFTGLTYNGKTGFFGVSEQQFVDCDDQMSHGCRGGDPNSAFVWAANNGGVTSERVYPYTSGNGASPTGNCQAAKVAQKLDGTAVRRDYPYTNVAPSNIAALEAAVRQQPVQIVVQGGPSFPGAPSPLQNYNGGIITLASGCAQDLDHSVLLVGYHSDTVDASQNYWIVKNSWSTLWGIEGYYYVAKSQENACGILLAPSFPNLAVPGQVPFPQPPTPAPVPSTYLETPVNQYIGPADIRGGPVDISAAQLVTLGNAPPYKVEQILPVEATLTINLDSITSSPLVRTCTPYITYVHEGNKPAEFLDFACAAYGNTSALATYTFVANVRCFIGQSETAPTPKNTLVVFALLTVNQVNYQLPLTSNNVMKFADINSTSTTVQRVFNDQSKGVGVKNIKFVLTNDYPTASPTMTPMPTFAPPSGNFISGSLITYAYSTSLDCTGKLVADKVQSYGLCFYDEKDARWTKITPGNPSVTSPTDPYSLPLVFRFYTDETCLTPLDPASSVSGIMVNECVVNAALGSSTKIVFVRNLDNAPVKNIAALEAGDAVTWSFNSFSACQSSDMSQALGGYSTKIGGCTSVPDNNPAYGFHSWNTVCSGTGFKATLYPDTKCGGKARPLPVYPETAPASACMYSSALKIFFRTTCGDGAPGASTASTDSADYKDTAIGFGFLSGGLFLSLILMLILYRKVKTELEISRAATINEGNEMINSMYATGTNNPINRNV